MSATLIGMGRKKPKQDEAEAATPKAGVIRVDGDISRKLAVIATAFDRPVQEIISPHLRPIVNKLYAEALRILGEEADSK